MTALVAGVVTLLTIGATVGGGAAALADPMDGMAMPMPVATGAQASGNVTSADGMRMDGAQAAPPNTTMATNASGVMSMYDAGAMRMDLATMSVRTMPAVTDLGAPMSREGSGTSWLPDASTVFGHMSSSGGTMFMTHGAGFARYDDTFDDRGSRTVNAPDWYMAMASRAPSPATQVGARVMLTSDFALVGGYGYPELFQTGESYHGAALHDHQHPHDLVSEAAVTYSAQLSRSTSAYVYAGYPGEPALGPPTYMHRLIAYDMADAPIGHHWEDSTHITFGVVTGGIAFGGVKVEGSAFTGREPDPVRTNFDPVHLDSVSGRVSWNPTAKLATQLSFGYVKSPEDATPTVDQHRTTASIVYDEPLGLGQFLTASAVFGQDYESTGARSNAYLVEADYHRHEQSLYARAEFVQKSGTELALDEDAPASPLAASLGAAIFPIGAYTLGYVHDLRLQHSGTVPGVGAQITLDTRPNALAPFYGPQTPWGFELFARFRPSALR